MVESAAPRLRLREHLLSIPTGRQTTVHVIVDGPWTGGDIERFYDQLGQMLVLDCFEPARIAAPQEDRGHG